MRDTGSRGPKHCQRMRAALWLYLLLLDGARRIDGFVVPNQSLAATYLGCPRRTFFRMLSILRTERYVADACSIADRRTGVVITKWDVSANFGTVRRGGASAKSGTGSAKSGTASAKIGTGACIRHAREIVYRLSKESQSGDSPAHSIPCADRNCAQPAFPWDTCSLCSRRLCPSHFHGDRHRDIRPHAELCSARGQSNDKAGGSEPAVDDDHES